MNILIVTAMDLEYNSIIKLTSKYKGDYIQILNSGIGKVNAAYHLCEKLIQSDVKFDLILNVGFGGGVSLDVNPGDIVVSEKCCYHDVYCGPEFDYGMVQGSPLFFETDKKYLEIASKIDGAKIGLICTGDKFIQFEEEVMKIKENFKDCLCCDMESTALAHVCHDKCIDFMSIRVISDNPLKSKNDYKDFLDFINLKNHSFEFVENFIDELIKQNHKNIL